jgi:hypothetical protein
MKRRADVQPRCIASTPRQTGRPQPTHVETRFIASSPYFPPYLINRTTSVARRTSTLAQPYYLIYPFHRANKVIRLSSMCAPLATEVVSFYIRSEIRYATAGIPASANDTCIVNPVETFHETSLQTQLQTHAAPVSVSHHTPPAPSQEGKGEAADATNKERRYTYIYCLSISRLPSLVERGRGRGNLPSDTAAGIRLPIPLWRGGGGWGRVVFEV